MDQFHNQIIRFQGRVKDYLDDTSMDSSRQLQNEVQRLEDEAQVNKNSHSVEDRVQSVMRMLQSASENGAMSPNHADELIDQCEEFIQQLRKM